MKKILFIVSLFGAFCTLSANAQSDNRPLHNLPSDSASVAPSSTGYNDAAVCIKKAGNNFIWAGVLTGASAASSWLAQDAANNAANNPTNSNKQTAVIMQGVTIAFAAAAVVCVLTAGGNLKKAGEAMKKIHPAPGGISIDL